MTLPVLHDPLGQEPQPPKTTLTQAAVYATCAVGGVFLLGLGLGHWALLAPAGVIAVLAGERLVQWAWRREGLPSRMDLVFFAMTLCGMTTCFYLLSIILFAAEWKGGQPFGWAGVINDAPPAVTAWPLWFAGQIGLLVGFAYPRWRYRSVIHLVLLGTLVLICAWYACSSFVLELYSGTHMSTFLRRLKHATILAAIPGMPCIGYLLWMVHVYRRRQYDRTPWLFCIGWLLAVVVSVVSRILIAIQHYRALPDEPQECFVATAASRGHRHVVGPRRRDAAGRLETRQLRTLRGFEQDLQAACPHLHRRLRAGYNVLGPWLAGKIDTPLRADVMHLALWPLAVLVRRARPTARR